MRKSKPMKAEKTQLTVFYDSEDNSPENVVKTDRSNLDQVLKRRRVTLVQAIALRDRTEIARLTAKERPAEEFKEWLLELKAKHSATVTVYALNMGYDLGNIFWQEQGEYDPKFIGSRMLDAKWQGITFRDVGNLWPSSVDKIGDAVGLPKLPNDGSDEYCMRDVEIIVKAHRLLKDFALDNGLLRLPNTVGTLSRKLFELSGEEVWSLTNQWTKEAYRGGRVEVFESEIRPGEMFVHADVVNMYGAQMLKAYPTEYDMEKRDRMKRFGISNVTMDIPKTMVCALPVRTAHGVAYPYGRVRGTWVNAEIRYAVERGCQLIELHESYGTDLGYHPFRKHVQKLMKLRIKAKKDDNQALAEFYKLAVNSLYGQFGMDGSNLFYGVDMGSPRCDSYLEWMAELRERGVITHAQYQNAMPVIYGGNKVLIPGRPMIPEHVNYSIAAHVTAYARITLLKGMDEVIRNGGRICYCDTDSIFYIGRPEMLTTGHEPGEWEIKEAGESPDGAQFIKPKMYWFSYQRDDGRIEKEKAVKGIPKQKMKKIWKDGVVIKVLDPDDYDRQLEFLQTGSTTIRRPVKAKEAIMNQAIPANTWKDEKKKHHQDYGKTKTLLGTLWNSKEVGELELLTEPEEQELIRTEEAKMEKGENSNWLTSLIDGN